MTDLDDQDGENEFIAVIGMAGRFPGAPDADAFWENLVNGIDTITRGAPQVYPGSGADDPVQTYTPARGLLDMPEWFDAEYFGYSAREAFLIDPQHRVFMECSVEALENAGQDPDRFPGAIGVYGGSTETSYAGALLARRELLGDITEDEILLATSPDFLALRTAERLGLRGPAIAVQAACATALVAIHTASRGLLAGDCDMALAGGVAVHVPPKRIAWTGPDGTLAPDGVCRAFDARGEGTVASNGVGVVVLKRLEDALVHGDPVRAVLRGSAVTNDGADRIGFTAPSVRGQAAAVREAQQAAGVHARTVTYVEAHGTATPLGDPIEIAALTQAFREDTDDRDFCSVGSVKTNIGHTDAAAGAAGFLKTVLALEHGVIPPSLHHTAPNPQIDFSSSPFRVADRPQPWEGAGGIRRAGVSSFAVGGVNAHLVLEEAPARPTTDCARSAQLFVHSARTPSALHAQERRLVEYLKRNPGLAPADVAWTLQTGRREHPYRSFRIVGAGEAPAADGEGAARTAGPARERPVAFLFPGEVAPAETWRLHSTEPAFRDAFRACLDGLDPELARSVKDVARGLDWPDDPVVRDAYVFTVEYSLAALWQRWGVRPAVVLGTGAGAVTAAAVAEVCTLPDALRLVVDRARSAQNSEAGGLAESLHGIALRAPRVPVVLAGDGTWHEAGTAADPDRWARALQGRPSVEPALATLLADPERILLEVGAGSRLTSLARQLPGGDDRHLLLAALPGLEYEGADVLPVLYAALGRLWLAGTPVSWEGVHDGDRHAKVPLPAYPFERLPYVIRHPDETEAEVARAMGTRPPEPGRNHLVDGTPELDPADDTHEDHIAETGGSPGTDTPVRPAGDAPLAVVLRLFGEALGLPDIGPEESFFDLGGDSLVATRLLGQLRAVYPVEISMRELFSAATAADLAALIEKELAGSGEGPVAQAGTDAGVCAGPAGDAPLAVVLRLFGEALGLPDIGPEESFFDL
ncbi:type I polyketide synthase, partial [Streptomyces sp. NPDC001848]|uniref:type I polyketide synthase n=1 Tax=Streptomyces sp. NPDC001848 TaxID=3364618 RepID=UPI0036BDC885